MSKILLHICCGPCGTASVKKLQDEGYDVVGFYYNPNIHPKEEYQKRLAEARKLADEAGITLAIPAYEPKEYFEAIKGTEENQKKRCPKCWELRLAKTAQKATELGIKEFGTTLRISPYQDQEDLLTVAKKIAKKEGLKFYEDDLVCCFRDSVSMSKEQGMYRQKYCGCIFSKEYK